MIPEHRIDRQRYWLAYFFDGMPVGAQFKPGALHLTIITWFVVDIDEKDLLDSFKSTFKNTKSFDVKTGELVRFGPKKDVPVRLLQSSETVMNLHRRALDWFEQINARWAVKDPHAGPGYMPHIRQREENKLAAGEVVRINSLSIVKARRREDDIRTVAEKVVFDE
ncbi:MAG TPA: 2'-5' RNA ligase family protein [Candidatus Saccharimonadales bacterium]|nr:2'-5' RNA ligase family protein [Candidatus Saccharimonadales bacterium]